MTITLRATHNEEICLCHAYMQDGKPDPDCTVCKGEGWIPQAEASFCHPRFRAIWSALGFSPDECGEADPDDVEHAINKYRPGLAEMAEGWYAPEGEDGPCVVPVSESYTGPKRLILGMDARMVQVRLDVIRHICIVAGTQGGTITWSA